MASIQPALPTTANELLALEIEQATRSSARRSRTGCPILDDLLAGSRENGPSPGVVVGVSAEGSEGEGVLISFHLLASFLIPHLPSPNIAIEVPNLRPKKPKVAIIDTTGSFPLPLLVNVLKLRILEYLSVNRAGLDRRGENAAEEAVQLCLEMVTISRVFDVAGLQEVLSEIERGDQPSHNYDIATPEQLMRSAEIFDSQEESLSPAATSPRRSPSVGDGGIEVIIVDNMTQIINELFSRRDKPNAQALLTCLSMSIHTLSRRQNILTLLHNSAVDISACRPQHQDPPASKPQPLTPSVFRSNLRRPGLGRLFEQFSQLHILISALPVRAHGAGSLYGGEDGGGMRRCWVFEVLKDECPKPINLELEGGKSTRKGGAKGFGSREGRWAPVDILDGIRFVPAFLES